MTDRDALDQLPDAVVVLDERTTIVTVNAAFHDLTGLTHDEVVGRSCVDAIRPRGRDGKPLLAGGYHGSTRLRSVRRAPEQQVEIAGAHGDVRAFVTASYQRTDDGTLAGAVLALRPAGGRTRQSVSGIEIVSTVSHELRSPLTSVKGYTSLLLNRWDRLKDEQKKMMLEQVNHDADRVTRLITELLDISRLETGRLVLRRQLVELPVIAARVVDKVGIEYPDLDCAVSFADDFPRVYADGDKLEQVLTNLVENAAKYASPTGMRLSGEVDGDTVSVAVADRGEGIPASALPRLFDKFFRAPDTKPTGSGLGLWISRGLVEAHGGTLEVTSTTGEGSVFRFTIPVNAFEELHPDV